VLDGAIQVRRFVVIGPSASTAVTTTSNVPAVVGVPDTSPVAGSTDSPGGRPVAAQVTFPVASATLHWS